MNLINKYNFYLGPCALGDARARGPGTKDTGTTCEIATRAPPIGEKPKRRPRGFAARGAVG